MIHNIPKLSKIIKYYQKLWDCAWLCLIVHNQAQLCTIVQFSTSPSCDGYFFKSQNKQIPKSKKLNVMFLWKSGNGEMKTKRLLQLPPMLLPIDEFFGPTIFTKLNESKQDIHKRWR